jgi:hypothetical protein
MEEQILEEHLSDEEREWRRRWREEQAEVTRKTRRCLGCPRRMSPSTENDRGRSAPACVEG